MSSAEAVGATERWRLDPNSPGSPSRRVANMATLLVVAPLFRSAPGEAQCPISFLLRYGNVWTDWRQTSDWGAYTEVAGKEETLQLEEHQDIVAISGYSNDRDGWTRSLRAKSSAGRSWGPHGWHRPIDGRSLRSSPDAPSNGLRLNHLSGDQTWGKFILRWLHQLQSNQNLNDCLHLHCFLHD